MIGIVDYGAGNLRSVAKAIDFLGYEAKILSSPDDFEGIERLILPGVGAFEAAMNGIRERDLEGKIADWLEKDRPFLGICLGMQVLFEESEENPGVKGFGALRGKCIRFQDLKVPQIGWNEVQPSRETPLLDGIDDGSFFYFLHGYHCVPEDTSQTLATTDYGIQYSCAVQKGNIHAVQFHPEKSSKAGLQLIRNWVESC